MLGPGKLSATTGERREWQMMRRRDAGAAAQPVAGQVTAPAVPPQQQHRLRRTRIGGLWVGLALSAIVLLLLLVFILENQQSANVGYFGAHGHLPLGVALLLAAVAGALLVIIPGTGRILQLRMTARRHRTLDAALPASASGPAAGTPAPGTPDPAAPAPGSQEVIPPDPHADDPA
jgi:uncharacterized integral membrane protein